MSGVSREDGMATTELDLQKAVENLRALLDRYDGCTEEGCGCPASVLANAVRDCELQYKVCDPKSYYPRAEAAREDSGTPADPKNDIGKKIIIDTEVRYLQRNFESLGTVSDKTSEPLMRAAFSRVWDAAQYEPERAEDSGTPAAKLDDPETWRGIDKFASGRDSHDIGAETEGAGAGPTLDGANIAASEPTSAIRGPSLRNEPLATIKAKDSGTAPMPTLEEWILSWYPGADLDKMEIPARVCIEIAKSYAWAVGAVPEKATPQQKLARFLNSCDKCGKENAENVLCDACVAAPAVESAPAQAALIKRMVERFLQWRLPENFNPDGGISFKKTFNEHTDYPMKHEPVGTNLFDATQAEEMIRYMTEGILSSAVESAATADARLLLLRAVIEIDYMHCAEDISQVASAEGKAIVEEGMRLLGLKDLSEEETERVRRASVPGEKESNV